MKFLGSELFLSPVGGEVILPEGKVFVGDVRGWSSISDTILGSNLPDLGLSNIWLGQPFVGSDETVSSRPLPFNLGSIFDSSSGYGSLVKVVIGNPGAVEEQRYVSFSKAEPNIDYGYGGERYVVLGSSPHGVNLGNAQRLDSIYSPLKVPNITKLSITVPDPLKPSETVAAFEIAIPGVDFLTLAQLEEAEVAIGASVFEHVGSSIIGAVSGRVVEVVPDPEHPDIKVKKIETTFMENAAFPGEGGVTIPRGTSNQRPLVTGDISGQIRYNTETNYFEGGYRKGDKFFWSSIYGAGKPTYIADTFGSFDNFYLGSGTGGVLTSGSSCRNTVIGFNCFAPIGEEGEITGNPVENVVIGYNAMKQCATYIASARYSVAIGVDSQTMTSADYNTSVGWQSLYYGGLSNKNVAIGAMALNYLGTGSIISPGGDNVAVGVDALKYLTKGSSNVAIGSGALQYVSESGIFPIPTGFLDGSVAIGRNALQGIGAESVSIVADGSVAIGNSALSCYSPVSSFLYGHPCIAIGYGALRYSRGGSSNLAIGFNASRNLNISTTLLTSESRHIAIGDWASWVFESSSSIQYQHPNLAIGVEALKGNESGRGNVAVGDLVFSSIRTGDFNTAIGYRADTEGNYSSNLKNAIAIGAFSRVETSNSLVLGGADSSNDIYYPDVAIGHNNPQYSLHVKNTGSRDKSIIAVFNTHNVPDLDDNHAYIYFNDGDAVFAARGGRRNIVLDGYGVTLPSNSDPSGMDAGMLCFTPQNQESSSFPDSSGKYKYVDNNDVVQTLATENYVDNGIISITGTDHQIMVTSGNSPVLSIYDNPTLPGKGYVIIPGGIEEEKPIATDCKLGMFRYTT